MPFIKSQLFINSTGQYPAGWSETYWQEATSLKIALDTLKEAAGLRSQCLGNTCELVAYRVSDVAVRGDSLIGYATYSGFKTTDLVTDSPWQSWLYRLSSGNIYRSMHHMRGVPDAAFNPDEGSHNTVRKLFGAFLNYLIKQQFRIKATPRGNDAPLLNIANITFDVTNQAITVTVVGGHGLEVANSVKISKTQCFNAEVNGTFQVLSITTPSAFVIKSTSVATGAIWVKGGQVQKLGVGYPQVDDYAWVRPSHKKVGRPFGQTRGRVSKR